MTLALILLAAGAVVALAAGTELRAAAARLAQCTTEGCTARPEQLGWCARHAPDDDPGPDEYWGER